MTINVLASGSRANAVLVSTARTRILCDCGLGLTEFRRALERIHVDPRSIDAIAVTHEHQDHAGGLGVISRKLDLPVFMTYETGRGINHGAIWTYGDHWPVGEITIYPIPVPHDACSPLGFVFQSHDDGTFGYFTDLGYFTDEVRDALAVCDTVMIEANHDTEMLAACQHPPRLKERIAGAFGHLSNDQVANWVLSAPAGLRRLILGHISTVANRPALAHAVVQRALDRRGLTACLEVA